VTSTRPVSILLVDDDIGMVDTLTDIFEAVHHRVLAAGSGAAAVAELGGKLFDVVLMDIQMPGLNGVQTLRVIRDLAPDLPVIMMTAYTRDELVQEAERISGREVLRKPLDVPQVLGLIAQIGGDGRGEESLP
jgi:two-component system, NtrC family, response regulator HydG